MTAPLNKAWFEDYEVSMALPAIELGPMDRFDYIPIALILRDTNPLHLDRVYAQERGLPDVVQQGPLCKQVTRLFEVVGLPAASS